MTLSNSFNSVVIRSVLLRDYRIVVCLPLLAKFLACNVAFTKHLLAVGTQLRVLNDSQVVLSLICVNCVLVFFLLISDLFVERLDFVFPFLLGTLAVQLLI